MSTTLDEAPVARRGGAAWLVLGLVALVVFDLTANPALAVAIGCLKFGWDELATARWLWARDPVRARGRVVSLYYAAWALWRVTGVALGLILLITWASQPILDLMRARGRKVPGVVTELVAAGFVMLFGTIATALTSILAIVSALRCRVRVWVGPEAKIARRLRRWPPESIPGRPTPNRVGWVSVAASMTLVPPMLLGMLLAIALLASAARATLGPIVPREVLVVLGGLAGVIVVPGAVVVPAVLILKLSDAIHRRIAAGSPEACWPPDDLDDGF